MQQLYQDSMAIVRHFGRPTLFITFTANPKWKAIVDELLPGQTAVDRPDLVARVFHIKQRQLLYELRHKNIFGNFLGYVWTIEYQKRGLPHMHLLLFLHPDNRFLTPERIDEVVCAELPDPTLDANGELSAIITSCMIHGPCGSLAPASPCMQSNSGGGKTCSKRYPKDFQQETRVQEDGYPIYRRRDDGRSISIPLRGASNSDSITLDNRWVVPYNPYLSWRYKVHRNVEVCASIQAIKYIHEYIYKGSDRTSVQLVNEGDEVQRYLQGRYIGPTEAVWRLFEFAMHEEYPSVMHLAIHLPGEQPIYFNEEESADELHHRIESARSTLMAFFEYNTLNSDGRQYLYQEFPTYFTYSKPLRKWSPRKLGVAIGRIYHCNPIMGEKYYLRLLLTVVRGAQSYESLRTVHDTLHGTFKAACIALGLLEDDEEWARCFEEAALFSSGKSLRILFTTALLFGDITDPPRLWNRFCSQICDDLEYAIERNDSLRVPQGLHDADLDYGLYLISLILADSGKTLEDFELPNYTNNWARSGGNELITTELDYDPIEQITEHDISLAKLNSDQRHAYTTILHSINDGVKSLYFVQGPAGTGKTFLYKVLCNYFRSKGKIVLCVASSGIAALLLPGGRTSHSRFKIPIVIHESSTCTISPNTFLAGLIKETSLIIWDEVPMQHRYCFEAVNRTLNDICGTSDNSFFGNISVILGGDFAQILPVIRRGNRSATVAACLQRSSLWSNFSILSLHQNMRVRNGEANLQFANWLRQMSYVPQYRGIISLPTFIPLCTTIDELCTHVFPTTLLSTAHSNPSTFAHRAILAMRNDTVAAINHKILSDIPGTECEYFSIDQAESIGSDGYENQLPAEYLQSLNLASLPPSKLKLKVGAPVILLRNLYPKEGLCNGTRMTVTRMHRWCIEVQILGGQFDGTVKVLPRIKLSTTEGELPFILTRKQFPIRLSFAMTVNKAQGQSLDVVGIDLREPAFTHGQLYVALSRVTTLGGLKVLLLAEHERKTQNTVYPEVLIQGNICNILKTLLYINYNTYWLLTM